MYSTLEEAWSTTIKPVRNTKRTSFAPPNTNPTSQPWQFDKVESSTHEKTSKEGFSQPHQ